VAEEVIDPRDWWMRRTGPFYSLLVAARGQTRLPVAPDLAPTATDRARARAWAPAVGALLGLALAVLAWIAGQLGLATGLIAALVACGWVIAGGAWAELGAAKIGERLIGRHAAEAAGVEGVEPAGLWLIAAFTLAVAVSLLIRTAGLLGTNTAAWIELLIVVPMIARWTPIGSRLFDAVLGAVKSPAVAEPEDAAEAEDAAPTAELVATAGVAIIAVLLAGIPGLAALLVAAGVAAAARFGGSEAPASLVLVTELAGLICFAAAATYPLF
jgi:hypothetical protein